MSFLLTGERTRLLPHTRERVGSRCGMAPARVQQSGLQDWSLNMENKVLDAVPFSVSDERSFETGTNKESGNRPNCQSTGERKGQISIVDVRIRGLS